MRISTLITTLFDAANHDYDEFIREPYVLRVIGERLKKADDLLFNYFNEED